MTVLTGVTCVVTRYGDQPTPGRNHVPTVAWSWPLRQEDDVDHAAWKRPARLAAFGMQTGTFEGLAYEPA